jgi:hypothetical protein
MGEKLTKLVTNKEGDPTCIKYQSVKPWLTIDGVRAAPRQIKVIPPKPSIERNKRAPAPPKEQEEKRQRIIVVVNKKVSELIKITHALQQKNDHDHTHRLLLEEVKTPRC